jgi:hypothetical protein
MTVHCTMVKKFSRVDEKGDELTECMSVVHEVGEGQTLCCSETADPNESDPVADKTEVGELVSFSVTNKFGDEVGEGQTPCCSETADPNESDPAADKTDLGELVSFSVTNRFEDGDPSH